MNNKKSLLFLTAVAGLVLGASAAQAQTFSFNVDINTSSLVSASNAPYYLDFQLNVGSSTLSNVATISNFSYTGGSATGTPTVFSGTATGDMGSSVVMTDSQASAQNEIYQSFSAGTTDIKFTVNLTQNPGLTPDGLFITILDGDTLPLFTTAPDTGSLVGVAITDANAIGDVSAYSSTDPSPLGVTATVSDTTSAVPEPSTWGAMVFAGLLALLGVRRMQSRQA